MASKSSKEVKNSAGKIGDLTQNDLRLAVIAWNCLIDNKIDLDKFLRATPYSNATSARVNWNMVRRKLEKYYTSLDNIEDSHATLSPSKPAGRSDKRKTANLDANDVRESDKSAPALKKSKIVQRKSMETIKAKNEDVEAATEPTEEHPTEDEYSADQQLIDEQTNAQMDFDEV